MNGTKNKIEDLRNHLFETIEQLKDPEKPMDLDRARAIAGVAKEIISSAKIEVDSLRVTGGINGSGFIPGDRQLPPAAPNATRRPQLTAGNGRVREPAARAQH